jgi:DnaJ-domain-containing protein 1
MPSLKKLHRAAIDIGLEKEYLQIIAEASRQEWAYEEHIHRKNEEYQRKKYGDSFNYRWGYNSRSSSSSRHSTTHTAVSSWAKVLGVLDSATNDEVKKAYREMAKASHPDHGGTQEGFLEVQEAYEEYKRSRGL